MKKIIVIGCPGSGKTTFAEKLRTRTELPLFYLDAIWHKPDKTHISREEYDARLADILSLDAWIIDGNYSRTIEKRLAACDTVFLFDLPVEVCLDGAISRLGKARYDMPWIDTEMTPAFREEIETFPTKNLPTIYALLEQYKHGKTIVVFHSRKEADDFLARTDRAFVTDLLSGHDAVTQIRQHTERLLSVIPELGSMVGFAHCHPHHHLDVWEHTLLALSFAEDQLRIRLSLLLHDVGKPFCYQQDGEIRHYHGHAERSAAMARVILERLGFDRSLIDSVTEMVRRHDTPLQPADIAASPMLSRELLEVQRCDALAHNPTHHQKRLAYIAAIQEMLDK